MLLCFVCDFFALITKEEINSITIPGADTMSSHTLSTCGARQVALPVCKQIFPNCDAQDVYSDTKRDDLDAFALPSLSYFCRVSKLCLEVRSSPLML